MDSLFTTNVTAMLVCSWFNILLYTAEIGLSIYFFMKHKSGSFYKWSLLLALAFDTAFTAVNCYNVYLWLFILRGPPLGPVWTLGTSIILTFATSTTCQVFFLHRLFVVSKNRIITLILAFLVVFHVVVENMGAIFQFIAISKAPSPAVRNTVIILGSAASATADIAITAVLFITLWRVTTAYTKTKSILQRISIHAIACGIVSAFVTVLDLILVFKSSIGFLAVFSIQGRLYTLNFLANLLLLKRLGHHESTTVLTTTDRTPHRATLDRVPGSVSLNTRISRDGQSFTIPIELSVYHSTSEGDNNSRASDFDRAKTTTASDDATGFKV